jgi:ribosome biogenesis GTPase A
LILAKSDLADAEETRRLIEEIKADTGIECLLVSLKTSSGKAQIMSACVEATKEKLQALVKKGILPRPMRVCVVGLPNVGKSSLINWLIGQNRTKTGNRPGITRGTQWVRVHPKLELLDTPGILPSASFSKTVKDRLAICNLIPDTTYDRYEIAEEAILVLRAKYPRLLEAYIEGLSADGTGLLEVATARNLLTSGAKPDVPRAAALFLSELRDGKVGRITLDP